MKKFINHPDTIISDVISAFCSIHKERVEKLDGVNVLARKNMKPGQVGVVIGNGSGHEPACIGFVGENALDCNAYGYLFAAPGPKHLLAAIKRADRGKGVLVLVSNHAGDILNSRIAVDWALEDGIEAQYAVLYDDVLSAPLAQPTERRGTAGTFFNYRMAGAYAAQGHSLEKVKAMVEKIRDNIRTVTLASTPGSSPISGEPMFTIAPDEYQIGIGVHGEASARVIKVGEAWKTAQTICDILLPDGDYKAGEELLVLVNGCGATTYMELLIFYGEVEKYLKTKGITVFRPAVGSFITTQEMEGIALSFCRGDDEIKKLWATPTDAPAFTY